MEIDWSKAPEWAEFHAIDVYGVARWFQNEPKAKFAETEIWGLPFGGVFIPQGGKYCTREEGSVNGICMNWRESLRRRYKKEFYL